MCKSFLNTCYEFESTMREDLNEDLRLKPENTKPQLFYNNFFPIVNLESFSDFFEFHPIATKFNFTR